MFTIAKEELHDIDIHISTQANNTNYMTYNFWWNQGAKRVVSARELSLEEIKEIREHIPDEMEIETFIHGAMCISYSGRCLLSNYMTGRDSNMGACAHPCRWNYKLVEETRPGEYMPVYENERGTYIFNSKDLCMINHIDKLAEAGAKLLVETLPHIFDGTAVYEKQPEESPTPYAGMITKQMGLINFGKSAEELERLVRGLNPWPSAFTFWNGKTLKVWESFVVKSEEAGTEKPEPGTVVKTDKKGIYVACGEDVLVLSQVQLEGKKRMDADAFLRGCHIETGSRFTDKKE